MTVHWQSKQFASRRQGGPVQAVLYALSACMPLPTSSPSAAVHAQLVKLARDFVELARKAVNTWPEAKPWLDADDIGRLVEKVGTRQLGVVCVRGAAALWQTAGGLRWPDCGAASLAARSGLLHPLRHASPRVSNTVALLLPARSTTSRRGWTTVRRSRPSVAHTRTPPSSLRRSPPGSCACKRCGLVLAVGAVA